MIFKMYCFTKESSKSRTVNYYFWIKMQNYSYLLSFLNEK